ncbi:hypothetical protein HY251_04710 [bacterium]|nr:hypothetical protein [bacterium]
MQVGRWLGSFAIVLALACLSGCASTEPSVFPDLGPLTDEQALAIIHSRTEAARSLQAVLSVTYESKEFDGTFTAVCNYEAPGKMRITAFKDIVLSTRGIFDILFTPTEYAIDVAEMGGTPAVHDRGKIVGFPSKHPRFAGFFLAGEVLFLPGKVLNAARCRDFADGDALGALLISGWLPSGAAASFFFDEGTLRPTTGSVLDRERRSATLDYRDWRKTRGVFIPGSVVFVDKTTHTTITCKVQDLDVNTPLDPSIFSPDSVGENPK